MSYSRCEIIATYHALKALGEPVSEQIAIDLIAMYENNGAVLGGKFIKSVGAIVGNQIYYVLSDDTVRRFDCGNQVDEEIFSIEDILKMYGQEKLSAYARVSITRTEKCLLLLLDEYRKEYIYICPIDGDLKKDCAEVNALFPEENKTGTEEVILYQGMYIKRYYDAERGV